jgi:hypothetical protein
MVQLLTCSQVEAAVGETQLCQAALAQGPQTVVLSSKEPARDPAAEDRQG